MSHRRRSTLHLPIWTSVVLLTINITLLVLWIVLLVLEERTGALAIGITAFALSLAGIGFYLFLTIKEIRLNRRQANFVSSVTHELKTPIASLRLYLETLQMRKVDESQQEEFYGVMETELQRLDRLINQLLEVGRLDALGHDIDPEDVELAPLLERCAESAAAHHKVQVADVFTFSVEPAILHSRRLLLEMIFGNLLDNSIKYAGNPAKVNVDAKVHRNRISVKITDNGTGIPTDDRGKIFTLFYRGGDELHRTKKGTGLGLYIVKTLVHLLKGRVSVRGRGSLPGSIFEVDLPGKPGSQKITSPQRADREQSDSANQSTKPGGTANSRQQSELADDASTAASSTALTKP